MNRAVFLDRDGVLVEDRGLPVDVHQVRIPDGVPEALRLLAAARYRLVVVSNQAVVARGWETEAQVAAGQATIEARLLALGAPPLDGAYFCPHHPGATLAEYRVQCDCRKPRPGLLLRAASELDVDLAQSFLVGDRTSDVAAGRAAGCQTVLIRSGQHEAPLIEAAEPYDPDIMADYACDSLADAAAWILAGAR